MLTSKNPWDKIFALYKMFDILSSYKENDQKKLGPIDRQLIKGVYSRSQHNYKHLQKDYCSDEEDTFKSSEISEDEHSQAPSEESAKESVSFMNMIQKKRKTNVSKSRQSRIVDDQNFQ